MFIKVDLITILLLIILFIYLFIYSISSIVLENERREIFIFIFIFSRCEKFIAKIRFCREPGEDSMNVRTQERWNGDTGSNSSGVSCAQASLLQDTRGIRPSQFSFDPEMRSLDFVSFHTFAVWPSVFVDNTSWERDWWESRKYILYFLAFMLMGSLIWQLDSVGRHTRPGQRDLILRESQRFEKCFFIENRSIFFSNEFDTNSCWIFFLEQPD